jgi:thiol-disulfide isomerase/thioredoxin
MVVSFAVPAQKRRTAKRSVPTKTVKSPVVAPLSTEALRTLLTEQRQRPLLVNFWATWCVPCREEFPDLVKIDTEYRPHALDFVTVSLDDLTEINPGVPNFLVSMKATMPAYFLKEADPEPAINAVDPRWQGDLPATFLYNERGEVIFKHIGRVDIAQLRAAIEKAVKKVD